MVEGQPKKIAYGKCHICIDPEIRSVIDSSVKRLGTVWLDDDGNLLVIDEDVCRECCEWMRGCDPNMRWQPNARVARPVRRDLSCHHCGKLPAPFKHEGQRRCEEHKDIDLCQ